MIRGTTAQFTFKLPQDLEIDDISLIEVRAWQNGYTGVPAGSLPIRREYTNNNWTSVPVGNDHTLVVELSPSDTSRFTDKLKGYIQCRVDIVGGAAYGTYQQKFTVYPMHEGMVGGSTGENSEVIEGWIILDGKKIIQDE